MKTVKLATFIENPDNPYKATEADLARLKGKLERVPKGLRCMRLGYVTDINKFPEHLRIRQVPWAR